MAAAIARELGVSGEAVRRVLRGIKPLPARWCPVLEELSGGKILCEDLRPDIRWGVLVERGRREGRAEPKTLA